MKVCFRKNRGFWVEIEIRAKKYYQKVWEGAERAKKMANSPLRPPTLASVKTWGIQQELVICRCKGKQILTKK